MNREIKFKVFIKEQNRIVFIGDKSNDTYIMFTEGTWFVYNTFNGKHELIASSEHDDILMQFTGIKDRDGKEIYDCDILQNTAFQDEKYVVQWRINAWYDVHHFDQNNNNSGTWSELINTDFKVVIGNIYEDDVLPKKEQVDEPDTFPIVALNPKPNLRFGINGSFFTIPLSVKLFEKDRFTIESINFDISVMEEGQESEKQEGVFLHKVRLVTSNPNDFIQSDNIKKGMKIVVL